MTGFPKYSTPHYYQYGGAPDSEQILPPGYKRSIFIKADSIFGFSFDNVTWFGARDSITLDEVNTNSPLYFRSDYQDINVFAVATI